MNHNGQRIEVLFAQTDHIVAIDLDGGADGTDVVDAVTTALEIDDPIEAERRLTESLPTGKAPALP